MIDITENNSITFTGGDTLELTVEIKNADGTQWIPDTNFNSVRFYLDAIDYTPMETIQELHGVTCTLPHQQLTASYKKVLLPVFPKDKKEEKSWEGAIQQDGDKTYGTLTIPASVTETWPADNYIYKLKVVTKESSDDSVAHIYTIVTGDFIIV